ncbi:MAG: hypothetical protein K2L18_04505, partial [Acetatifactor sp.]|nr:hypothetical protein [Acetatifactor sp.]
MNGFWRILEIEPTRDISAIRHAYAKKTGSCHPEENPEGFLELRKAYQAAMDYAKQGSIASSPALTWTQERTKKDTSRPAPKEQPEEAARRIIPEKQLKE